ncbi:hypothetical protein [Streptomyces sp. NPDC059819]|uniref:hypothetical protein n=1 Tax=Streptomyces sp. NPDC059819 TaxID=3346963 RepID=UPI001E01BF28|nr:hypothetical protein [Streptomyces sp. MAG02]
MVRHYLVRLCMAPQYVVREHVMRVHVVREHMVPVPVVREHMVRKRSFDRARMRDRHYGCGTFGGTCVHVHVISECGFA